MCASNPGAAALSRRCCRERGRNWGGGEIPVVLQPCGYEARTILKHFLVPGRKGLYPPYGVSEKEGKEMREGRVTSRPVVLPGTLAG